MSNQNIPLTHLIKWKPLADCGRQIRFKYQTVLVKLPEWNDFYGYWWLGGDENGHMKKISEQEAQKEVRRALKVLNRLKKQRSMIDRDLVQMTRDKYPSYQVCLHSVEWKWKNSSNEKAKITSHKHAKVLRQAVSAECWLSDGDLPCQGMKGEVMLRSGATIPLWGTRDVGIRTGYPPCMNLDIK